MYKLYFIYISFLLLLSLNFIGKSQSYIIEDVSLTDHLSKAYSSLKSCTFGRLLLCIETNPGDNCTNLEITGSSPTITNQTSALFSNETSYLFTIFFITEIGSFNISINSLYSLNVECLQLDLDKVELQLTSNGYFSMYDGSMGIKPRALYKMVGDVDPSASLHFIGGYSNYGAYLQNILFSTNYVFEYSGTLNTNMNLSNITHSFYNGVTKEFKLEPIGKGVFDNIYNIKTYPDGEYLSDLELFGYSQTALLQFTSNNTALSNFYTVNLNGYSTPTQITPVYGDENSTTYLYQLKKYDSPNDLYELYYVNNAEFIKSNVSIKANIKNYKVDSYPSNTGSFIVDTSNDIPMIVFGLYDNKTMKDFHSLAIYSSTTQISTVFPFGYSSVSPYGYNINISLPIGENIGENQYIQLSSIFDSSGYSFYFPFNSSKLNSTSYPVVYDYELIRIVEDIYLFRVYIRAPNGFKGMNIHQTQSQHYGKELLVSGDLYDGVYEFVSLTCTNVNLDVYDNLNLRYTLGSPTYVSYSPLKIFISPAYKMNVNIFSMYDVSFLYNDLDVTNRRHYNVMYFSLPNNFPTDYQVGITYIFTSLLSTPVSFSNPIDSSLVFFNTWNSTLQKHQIPFYVDANSQTGIFSFWILINLYSSSSEFLDGQLRIKKSNIDLFGPKFKQIKKIIPPTIDGNNKFGIVGWTFEIEDTTNGFDYGHIIITGELDKSTYNISLRNTDVKPGGDLYLGEYDVTLNISAPCISQNYIITEVVLFDRVKRASTFYSLSSSSEYSGVINVFMYHLNDSSINKVPLTCATDPIASTDTTPPILSSFTVSNTIVDVSATNRQVTFTFTATDNESGIKNHQYPIVYLVDKNVLLQCKSKILSYDKISSTYSCTIQLPISFGYPDNIILSVYNFVNNNGYSSGYSTAQLKELGLQYYINTTFNTNEPSITGHYKFISTGGDLFLYGRCFDSSTKVNISYYDGTSNLIEPTIISSTVIKVPNIPATTKQFNVYVKTSSFISNTITVTPLRYDYYLQEPTPTFPPTVTPVPTNSPQQCPGNPICGGPSNGKCIANQGCVCYSPWIGIDCLSQIIVVNPPIINTGNHSNGSGSESDENGSGSPSIEIIVPGTINNNTNNGGGNNNNNTTPITYTSLISIVAIREVDIYGGVVKTYTFKENWLSRQLDTLTYAFYTSIEDENKQSTNITAILKWFTNQTTISFADEELTMNPSSMKYTIEIGYYPFSSSLNQLQLVMSALIQSNTTENVCSVKEFGETTSGDNSNYLKIQVDNHSLYGRFIRRGIVDSNIRTVTNVLLDKDMNPITSSKSLQSYIGIQIPNYKETVIIDPDFSVILDSYSASSKSNSICASKSKLSTGKIVGIALGAAAFAAVVGISLTYYFKKKHEENKFLSSVNNKMEVINNDNL